MINRTSALDNHFKTSEQLIEGKANLTFARKIDLQIIQIAAWPDTVSKVESMISKHLNENDHHLLILGPFELLLFLY